MNPWERYKPQQDSAPWEQYKRQPSSELGRENIYRQDTGEVIDAPVGSSGAQIVYQDDTYNRGVKQSDYVGYRKKPMPEQSTFDSVMGAIGTPLDVASTGIALTSTMVQKAATGVARILSRNVVDSEILEDFVRISESSNDFITAGLNKNLEKYKTTAAGAVATDIGVGVSQLPFYVGAAVTTGGAGLAAIVGSASFEDFYREAVRSGKSEEAAETIGAVGGIAIGALNTIYIGRLMSVADDVMRPMLNKILVNTGNGAIGEGAEALVEEGLLGATGVRDNTVGEAASNIAYQAFIGGVTFGVSTPAFGGSYKGEKMSREQAVEMLTEAGAQNPEQLADSIVEMANQAQSEVVSSASIDVEKANADNGLAVDVLDSLKALDDGRFSDFAASLEKAGAEPEVVRAITERLQSIKLEADGDVAREEAEIEATNLLQETEAVDSQIAELEQRIGERQEAGQANTANQQALVRLQSRKDVLTQAIERVSPSPEPVIQSLEPERQDAYRVASRGIGIWDKVTAKFSDRVSQFRQGAANVFEPIDSRIIRINEKIGARFRRYQAESDVAIADRANKVEPLIRKLRKIPKRQAAVLDLAMKNRWQDDIDVMAKRYGIEQELKQVREVLDTIRLEALEQGIDVGYLENYYPRMIKDVNGFIKALRKSDSWTMFDEAIHEVEQKTGRVLTDAEKSEVIRRMLMGQKVMGISLRIPSGAKERNLDTINEEFARFYAPTSDAIVSYINDMTEAIEQRKFFGAKKVDPSLQADELDNIISTYVLRELAAGNIAPGQEAELQKIFEARFRQERTSPIVRLYKNSQYLLTMGSVKSAITQIGDVYMSLYFNGFYNTLLGISDIVSGKTPVSRKELNINTIAAEFNNDSISGKMVDLVFTANFLKAVDAFGKTTLLNSSLRRIQSQAKRGNKRLQQQLDFMFEGEAEQVMKDLAAGNITQNVKVLMATELMRAQPITLSQMPKKYLDSPNGRVFYMLKTFTLKHLDIVRTEVFDQFRTDPLQAGQNLVRLAAFFVIMGATADEIKDLLFGRQNDLSDTVIDNILKFAGASKFQVDRAKRQPLGETLKDTIFPPAKVPKSVRDIPVAGELYYYWFGREDDSKKKNPYKRERDGI